MAESDDDNVDDDDGGGEDAVRMLRVGCWWAERCTCLRGVCSFLLLRERCGCLVVVQRWYPGICFVFPPHREPYFYAVNRHSVTQMHLMLLLR